MESILVMKDLAAALKELGATEMSAVSGGKSCEGIVHILPFPFHGGYDDDCGTPALKPIKLHPVPIPFPVPLPCFDGPIKF
jgi:hypothetical protein